MTSENQTTSPPAPALRPAGPIRGWVGAGGLALGLCLIAAVPLVTLADRPEKAGRAGHLAPATRPTDPSGDARPGRHPRPERPANSPEDNWPEVQSFMEKHSRRKLATFQKLNPERKRALRGQLITRFNDLSRLANKDNKGLYDLEVERVEIEDDLYGALSSLQRLGPGPKQDEARRQELRPVVERLIQNRMKERSLRLENTKVTLKNLEEEVEHDRLLQQDPVRFREFVARRAATIASHGLGDGHAARHHPAGERAALTTAPVAGGPGRAAPGDAEADPGEPAE